MTARCPSVPIMRSNHCWTVLRVSILAALLLTLNADGEDCEVVIKVRRNTEYDAFVGEELRINCTVVFCNNSPPTVSWFKFGETTVPVNVSSSSHIKTEWKELDDSQGISYLVFKNILMSDSGEYQCHGGNSVSHNINVSVFGNQEHNIITPKNDSKSQILPDPEEVDLWMYVYTAAGIVTFVIIVIIISVTSMHVCKGKPKKETQTENQYMAIPMVEQPLPHANLQALPRGNPSEPPSRSSTRRTTPPSQPNELPLPRDNEPVYGKAKKDRERPRNTVEEEASSLVYAALNHQLPAGAAARPRRQMEETSEYAAIRVKDY